MIDDDLGVLRMYAELGVRYLTLTHFHEQPLGGLLDRSSAHNGLTEFGKDVVRELNRLGVMVDISHVADKTFYDALEVSKAPLMASHSSCRAISGHARNMSDEMIKALAEKGGVIQINYEITFLSEEAQASKEAQGQRVQDLDTRFETLCGENTACEIRETERLDREAMEKGELPQVSWRKIVEHIDHVVKLVGPDHVGLGSGLRRRLDASRDGRRFEAPAADGGAALEGVPRGGHREDPRRKPASGDGSSRASQSGPQSLSAPPYSKGVRLSSHSAPRDTFVQSDSGIPLVENPVICVVDDDFSVRRALRRLLEAAGYQVEALESAAAYCERYSASQPHCLVLDIRMAAMSGLDLQRRLRSQGCAPPIVFITAYSKDDVRDEALASGAIDVLHKPLRRDALLEAIGRALRS